MPSYDAERDLRILQAMADQLEPYLIADDLFWPLSGRVAGGMPRLTVGGLLLRRHRLTALHASLTPRQQDALAAALAQFAAQRDAWAVHYNRKMAREWDMRQRLLEEFLHDCDDQAAADCADYWPNQARQRTILHHLSEEAEARHTLEEEQRRALARLDAELRRYLQPEEPGQFLWSPELEPVYPRETYWWLWVVPAEDSEATV